MNIEITKSADHYRADCKDLPGSPPVGTGDTPELAMACLMWHVLFGTTGTEFKENWQRFLKKEDPITVNGVMWKYPDSYRQ
jgi:hypothetical protein